MDSIQALIQYGFTIIYSLTIAISGDVSTELNTTLSTIGFLVFDMSLALFQICSMPSA